MTRCVASWTGAVIVVDWDVRQLRGRVDWNKGAHCKPERDSYEANLKRIYWPETDGTDGPGFTLFCQSSLAHVR